jgi:hypothetical protein
MTLKPSQLTAYLQQLVAQNLPISTMIWGPPGIGKSSIVAQVAQEAEMQFIDLRLSQLAPTDLRGLPVPLPPAQDEATGTSTWYPPEFLPRQGKGILFLDELNMAPPAMQGVAQQLILDRRVGSYVVPDGWFLWAAGNRKEDRASVFEMGSPGKSFSARHRGGRLRQLQKPCPRARLLRAGDRLPGLSPHAPAQAGSQDPGLAVPSHLGDGKPAL